jgi:hypothetical protein
MEWVSFEEKLPERNGRCIVLSRLYKNMKPAYYYAETYERAMTGKDLGWTHWMYLDIPPPEPKARKLINALKAKSCNTGGYREGFIYLDDAIRIIQEFFEKNET